MVYIIIKNVLEEDFQDYKKTSMLIATCKCDWKCLKEKNLPISICQNNELLQDKNINISNEELIKIYLKNPLTEAIVFGGLEPMLQFEEIYDFIRLFRQYSEDDIVIYTGYYLEEIKEEIKLLTHFPNIIVKFGRFVPDSKQIYDDILGVKLISENQFAIKIS